VIRLFDRHNLLQAHQLPLLQLLISGVSRISLHPALVQYMLALIGALAGVGFYRLVADIWGEASAWPAALLFVTHPYILAVSTVPFQEILMLTGLLFAFHFFYKERWLLSSVCLGLACLSRYEAWLACPVLAGTYFWRNRRSLAAARKALAWFGSVPVLWIVARHGVTSTGHFAWELPESLWRFQRYAYLGWITAKFTQFPVLLLAMAGIWRLAQKGRRMDWRIWVQIAFVALFLVAILFSAHGVMPDPERYVTSREAHIPMYFTLLLAAAGLACLPRLNTLLVLAAMVWGIVGAIWYVRMESSVPHVQLDYRVARYLDGSLGAGERAVLFVPPIAEDQAQLYVDKAWKTGGPKGLRQAQRELQQFAATPPDYQRVVIYSRLGRQRLLVPPACGEWIAVWNQYPEAARELAGSKPVHIITTDDLTVSILRRRCPL
jgi:hypothetical protein